MPAHRSFWNTVREQFSGHGDDAAFKDAVVKDQETISLVAALVATIAFAGLAVPVDEASVALRLTYLGSVALSIAFSILGCMVAVRTMVLINCVPPVDVIKMLCAVDAERNSPNLNPFSFTTWAVAALMVSACAYVACIYGIGCECAMVSSVMLLTGVYLQQEMRTHYNARAETYHAKEE